MDQEAESSAMSAVGKALELLDETVRQRVISWAASRFGTSLPPPNKLSAAERNAFPTGEAGRGEFESFAELFEAADPKTDKDRALVAAYWAQICQSQATFPAQTLNASLKDLGHGLSNVTVALEALKEEKPALVLQLKKTRTSKQTRKNYKLPSKDPKPR